MADSTTHSNGPREARGPYLLAFDHGTSGLKSAIVSARGEVMGFEFAETPIFFESGGLAEQNPDDWWNALIATSQKLVRSGVVPPEDIAAVCVSSTFSTTVAVDEHGAPVMNALTWMDSRGAPHVRKLMSGFPSFDGYGIGNIIRWIRKTGGGPTLSGKDDIAHALLVKHEFPDVYARTRTFLPSKDYLNLRLTGKTAASHDSMHLFWLSDIRDPDNIRYDPALIRRTGIDPDKLPPLKRSTDILGDLKPEVAAQIGLPKPIPVVMGAPDHQAACIGSGAVRDYEAHLYIGTSSWIECMVPFKRTDVLHSIASFPSSIPGRYQCINEQDLAGGCLKFLADHLLFHRFVPPQSVTNRYEMLDEIADAVPPGSSGVIFTPWLNGERTPVDDEHLRGGIHNLSTTSTLDDIVRAVMEGVALNTRWSLGYVEKFVRRRLDPIRIVGGGGLSEVWCQIFADVLDREIHAVRDPLQANARGAAFIGAVGLGEISFDDLHAAVPVERRHMPNPANRKLYDELFEVFQLIHRRNKAIYHRLNRR